jgi:hypothetical protein
VQAGKKSPAPSAKPAAKGDSLEQLELQVLSKYGSNAFREALEEGWEDDEDDEEEMTKRREPAVPGSIKLNKRGKLRPAMD